MRTRHSNNSTFGSGDFQIHHVHRHIQLRQILKLFTPSFPSIPIHNASESREPVSIRLCFSSLALFAAFSGLKLLRFLPIPIAKLLLYGSLFLSFFHIFNSMFVPSTSPIQTIQKVVTRKKEEKKKPTTSSNITIKETYEQKIKPKNAIAKWKKKKNKEFWDSSNEKQMLLSRDWERQRDAEIEQYFKQSRKYEKKKHNENKVLDRKKVRKLNSAKRIVRRIREKD